ncbi:MAG TPA: PhaM family polyhydroxyalkanoate granule multifunctional regulatory protein [Rhodocyclaceae bacterium]|nr:PhaM family polyhydroxyalkanoate granule multifunctional regulatory protein [Rhodocyclaceae bacterium]
MSEAPQDPLEFLKSMWGSMGFPLPGMVTPTLDVGELDKRITDLKAVENWLKMNLGMLQISIQGLEMQRATLATMQAVGSTAGGEADAAANPGLWPWNIMQQAADAAGVTPPPKEKK